MFIQLGTRQHSRCDGDIPRRTNSPIPTRQIARIRIWKPSLQVEMTVGPEDTPEIINRRPSRAEQIGRSDERHRRHSLRARKLRRCRSTLTQTKPVSKRPVDCHRRRRVCEVFVWRRRIDDDDDDDDSDGIGSGRFAMIFTPIHGKHGDVHETAQILHLSVIGSTLLTVLRRCCGGQPTLATR